jgi:hypothetical protein
VNFLKKLRRINVNSASGNLPEIYISNFARLVLTACEAIKNLLRFAFDLLRSCQDAGLVASVDISTMLINKVRPCDADRAQSQVSIEISKSRTRRQAQYHEEAPHYEPDHRNAFVESV